MILKQKASKSHYFHPFAVYLPFYLEFLPSTGVEKSRLGMKTEKNNIFWLMFKSGFVS